MLRRARALAAQMFCRFYSIIEASMKALRVYEYGSPEVLRLEEIADPVAGVGEVLIEIGRAHV